MNRIWLGHELYILHLPCITSALARPFVSNCVNSNMMSSKLFPAAGIILVSLILLVVNEFTESTFIRDYAFILIISGMLLGVWFTKLSNRSKDEG